MTAIKRARLLITVLVSLFLIGGTITAIYFARGYRPNFTGTTTIEGTGLLAASSYPEQSAVYIDDKLVTTTNDTINLIPGNYRVRITREGFIAWEKQLLIEKELVTLTNARLFPAVPSLTALTTSGAQQPTPSPDGQKIAYLVTQSSLNDNNGLFILPTGANPLGLERKATQILRAEPGMDLTKSIITWSPDSRQLLVVFPSENNTLIRASYLLETDRLSQIQTQPDVTVRLPFIFSDWERDLIDRDVDLIANLPEFMVNVASASATNIYFSPDGERMLYTATKDLIVPENLIPPLASVNSTPQNRSLVAGRSYVYDLKEDTNYLIDFTATVSGSLEKPLVKQMLVTSEPVEPSTQAGQTRQTLSTLLQQNLTPLQTIAAFKAYYHGFYTGSAQWYPTSRHLTIANKGQIVIFEYDNTNHATVYTGPFASQFVFPSPDGHRLYFLTNLGQTHLPENLYIIDLK